MAEPFLDRRNLLRAGGLGLGGAALASLLGRDGLAQGLGDSSGALAAPQRYLRATAHILEGHVVGGKDVVQFCRIIAALSSKVPQWF